MKKLTLNQTWKLCLQMWRWIAKQIKEDSTKDVVDLKITWVRKHHYDYLRANCFFCEKAGESDPAICHCPAKKIDPTFSCYNKSYEYDVKPIPFYNKIVSLNRKRLKKGKKT